ncbi:hypothetical protein M426DRAFT_104738 [Hypoxylon sp. CI-4A]|nr:hypothetical protein M426DRAFT_104738 [Hypoxylon sp. CI-4A]
MSRINFDSPVYLVSLTIADGALSFGCIYCSRRPFVNTTHLAKHLKNSHGICTVSLRLTAEIQPQTFTSTMDSTTVSLAGPSLAQGGAAHFSNFYMANEPQHADLSTQNLAQEQTGNFSDFYQSYVSQPGDPTISGYAPETSMTQGTVDDSLPQQATEEDVPQDVFDMCMTGSQDEQMAGEWDEAFNEGA